ncbi:MAG: hypothetical protein SWX82_03625 [Cyanobacteriota bacterium]|nr:hypothetical protein [Cyanobacteriota bacterium]
MVFWPERVVAISTVSVDCCCIGTTVRYWECGCLPNGILRKRSI